MRGQLRSQLGTLPTLIEPDKLPRLPKTGAYRFADRAHPVLNRLAFTLQERTGSELLMGFPAAPFVLPLATDDVTRFLNYTRVRPDHVVRLRPPGQGAQGEWRVSPDDHQDSALNGLEEYQLAFNLPEHLQSWISEHEKHRVSRARTVKKQFLSDIVIYRMEGDSLQTFQLHYNPSELNRRRRSRG